MTMLQDLYLTGARRLRQWARVGIGRLIGSTTDQSGIYKAAMALEEGRLIVRAEVTALHRILVEKGVATTAEVVTAMIDEMNELAGTLAKEWPEIEVLPDGTGYSIKDAHGLAARAQREGWPR